MTRAGAREASAGAKALRQGVALLCKALLVHLHMLSSDPEFPHLWSHTLTVFQVL